MSFWNTVFDKVGTAFDWLGKNEAAADFVSGAALQMLTNAASQRTREADAEQARRDEERKRINYAPIENYTGNLTSDGGLLTNGLLSKANQKLRNQVMAYNDPRGEDRAQSGYANKNTGAGGYDNKSGNSVGATSTGGDDKRQAIEGAQVKLGNAVFDKNGAYVLTEKGIAAARKASDDAAKAEAAAKRAITQAEAKAKAAADNSVKGADNGDGLINLALSQNLNNNNTGTDTGTDTVFDDSSAAAETAAAVAAAETAAAAAATAAKAAAAEDKAAAEKLAKETAAIAEALRIKQDNLASGNKLKNRISTTMETDDSVEETGLVSSWMPKWLQESLKGEGNYDPAWVEKNKVAGAKSLESMYDSGQLERPRSNITDSYGNAIGGVANSQDNTAMQRLAAGGSTDPMGDLSSQIVKEDGIDSSWTGAFNQAIDGAEGSEFTGGGGLLKFSQDQDKNAIFGDAASPVDGFTETERFGNSNEFATIDANQDGEIDAAEATTFDLEKFRDNLGFANAVEAQAFWDSMTPEEQAIFNSKENPSNGTKILQSIFGLFVPGSGLLNEYMYNDDMTLQEKFEFAVKTSKTVSDNKDKLESSTADTGGGASEGVVNQPDGSVENPDSVESDTVKYQTLETYLAIFGNYKFQEQIMPVDNMQQPNQQAPNQNVQQPEQGLIQGAQQETEGADVDAEETYKIISGQMLNLLYDSKESFIETMRTGGQQESAVILARIMVMSINSLKMSGKRIEPGVMLMAMAELSQALGEIAIESGVMDKDPRMVEESFFAAIAKADDELQKEALSDEDRTSYATLMKELRSMQQQSEKGRMQQPQAEAQPQQPEEMV